MSGKLEQQESAVEAPKAKQKDYTLRIGTHLHKRIDQHLRLLKYLNTKSIKQKWLEEAIREKLETKEPPEEDIGDKFLHLKLDLELWRRLENKVDALKPNRSSMSKKIIIEEAILEKLDREEAKSKELLRKMVKDNPIE